MSSVGNKLKSIFLFKEDKQDSILVYGVLLLLILKLILFPITQTVDADAVSRTLISYGWLKNPHFITDSVWAPLHFYMNGVVIWLTGWVEDGPRLLNVFLSCLLIVPFYFFVKSEFNRKGAILSAGVVAFSPIIFRNSFQALSGTPYLFFLALGLFFFAKALRGGKVTNFIFGGLSITLAAGFRYEAWIIIAIFTLLGILRKQWKGTLVFWCVAMIIPISWMLVGYIYHDDFLYGINGAYGWNIEKMDVNANVNVTERLKRLIFFPMSWFLVVSPLLGWVLIVSFFRNIKKKIFSKEQYLWMLPLLVIILAFLMKAQDGTLLLQHRFTASWVFLSAPLFALVLSDKARALYRYLLGFAIVLILPQTYFWYRVNLDEWTPMSRQIKSIIKDIQMSTGPELLPIPQIDNPLVEKSLQVIKGNWKDGDGFILDFFGWTETFYFALQYPEADPFIFPGAKNDVFPNDYYHQYIIKKPKGKLILYCASNYTEYLIHGNNMLLLKGFSEFGLKLEMLYSEKGFKVFNYEMITLPNNFVVESDPICFEEGSVEYFESKAYFMGHLHETAKRLQRDADLSLEEAINQIAIELNEGFKNEQNL